MKVTSIRFNLKFFNADGGEEVVRTLDDLRDKFNLCDLWDYFKSGDLVKWLKSIDELTMAASVESLSESDKHSDMQKICEMLGLSVTDDEIFEMCEVLDHHERTKDWHEKTEKIRSQMKSGTITSENESENICCLANQYYIDDFNYVMGELKKFEDEDFGNVAKLKAFEQKFVTFLNRWGHIFICEFANKLFTLRLEYHALPRRNGSSCMPILGTIGTTVFTGLDCECHYELPVSMVLLLSLMAVNKRWGDYLCYSLGNGTPGGGFGLSAIKCDSNFAFFASENPARAFSPSFLEAVTFNDFSTYNNRMRIITGLIF